MDLNALSPTAQRWARLVADLDRSTLTVAAFAARHGVNPSTLSSWRSRLSVARSRGGIFVEVAVPPTPSPVLDLELPDFGARVAVPRSTDLAWLRTVLAARA